MHTCFIQHSQNCLVFMWNYQRKFKLVKLTNLNFLWKLPINDSVRMSIMYFIKHCIKRKRMHLPSVYSLTYLLTQWLTHWYIRKIILYPGCFILQTAKFMTALSKCLKCLKTLKKSHLPPPPPPASYQSTFNFRIL